MKLDGLKVKYFKNYFLQKETAIGLVGYDELGSIELINNVEYCVYDIDDKKSYGKCFSIKTNNNKMFLFKADSVLVF